MKIIFTHLKPDIWQYKVSKSLIEKKVKTVSISLLSPNNKMFEDAFSERICLGLPNLKPWSIFLRLIKNPISFFRFFSKISRINADAAICQGAPHYLTSFFIWLFKGKFPRIYFPYDINHSRYCNPKEYFPLREIWGEKYSFVNCDAIIQKGAINELYTLPKSFKIYQKPIIEFSTYPFRKWFVSCPTKEKFSHGDNNIHLVYTGMTKDCLHVQFTPDVREILKQKIHMHLYTGDKLNKEDIFKMTFNRKELKKYLHIHEYVSPNKLSREISKYDFGCHTVNFTKVARKGSIKYICGNKRPSYFEALIPIIAHKNAEFVGKDVAEKGIGIIVKDVKEIKEKIKKFNYPLAIKNLEKFRSQNSVEKNVPRLINFVKSLDKQDE